MHRESPDHTTRRPAVLLGAAALLLGSAVATADAVHFKTGDRLTGTLVDAPEGFVAIDVPHVGVVTVPLAQTDRVRGTPAAAQGAPAAASGTADNEGGNPWRARADLGLSVATGNTQAADLRFVAGVERQGPRFDNVLGVAVHNARASRDTLHANEGSTRTKDQVDFDYNLRWKYGDSWYAVANFEYFQDPIKDIDQRATTGAGVGHTVWQSALGSLRTDAGISRVFEQVRSTPRENNPALRWGLQFNRWLVAERLELFHNNQLLHILDNEPSSVWDSDTGIRLHVNDRWLAAVRVDLQHETAPAPGRRKTDSSYAVAVGLKL